MSDVRPVLIERLRHSGHAGFPRAQRAFEWFISIDARRIHTTLPLSLERTTDEEGATRGGNAFLLVGYAQVARFCCIFVALKDPLTPS